MKTILIFVSFELILEWTFIHIGCVGMPIQETVPDAGKQSRFARSLHALHSRLCPEGSSSESCFYSQLNIFMRMQDNLMDPVVLRNIGKRNGGNFKYNGVDRHKNKQNPELFDIGLTDLPSEPLDTELNLDSPNQLNRFISMLNDFTHVYNGNSVNLGKNDRLRSKSESSLFNTADFGNNRRDLITSGLDSIPVLNDIMENDDGQNDFGIYDDILGLENNQENSDLDDAASQMNPDNIRFPSVRKRQIICQPGVSRLNCYDNALAFYIRLLDTMKDH